MTHLTFSHTFTDPCDMAHETGPCYADVLRFYFDKRTGKCRPFKYGGCGGNINNFESQESCLNRCSNGTEGHRIMRAGKISGMILHKVLY